MSTNGAAVPGAGTAAEELVARLAEPRTAAALHALLDNAELLALMVGGLGALARKGDVISDTVAEVIAELRAAGRATGMDPRRTTVQLSTLIPTLADATPTIDRIIASPVFEPEPLAVVGSAAEALAEGARAARESNAKLGPMGLLKAARDEDVQRGLGFMVEVARAFGRQLAAPDGGAPTETKEA